VPFASRVHDRRLSARPSIADVPLRQNPALILLSLHAAVPLAWWTPPVGSWMTAIAAPIAVSPDASAHGSLCDETWPRAICGFSLLVLRQPTHFTAQPMWQEFPWLPSSWRPARRNRTRASWKTRRSWLGLARRRGDGWSLRTAAASDFGSQAAFWVAPGAKYRRNLPALLTQESIAP
jgi:hypothetical protein